MIADQKIGKNFIGALGYNLKKLNLKDHRLRAELLETNFASLDIALIKKEIDHVRGKRPTLGKYVYHTSLNFLEEETEKLDNNKLLAIAGDYLQGMGFTDNQYMIFRHHDAGHPHIHLLVNRITFDGEVVSDSNNFKRSEALLRKLERLYDLKPVIQSKFLAVQATKKNIKVFPTGNTFKRAPKKDEIEMAIRSGQASNKMLVQEKLSLILNQRKRSMQDFIQHCEAEGVHLLFNQASTGYISGVTFFYKDFKAKGQALGSRFKWAEIVKQLNYEQNRDRKAISEANARTRTIYGQSVHRGQGAENGRKGNVEPVSGYGYDTGDRDADRAAADRTTTGISRDQAGEQQRDQVTASSIRHPLDNMRDHLDDINSIEISEDVDDEAIYGRDRRRQHKARENTR